MSGRNPKTVTLVADVETIYNVDRNDSSGEKENYLDWFVTNNSEEDLWVAVNNTAIVEGDGCYLVPGKSSRLLAEGGKNLHLISVGVVVANIQGVN